MSMRSATGNTGRKHLCFDRLLDEQPYWALRFWLLGAALVLAGSAVISLTAKPLVLPLQALFFAALFAWAVWPLFAARYPSPCRRQR
ncbi:hypothetical protein D0Y83_10935 [Qipengyuania flava]|uniref:Uncharacterized protein n=1 Tax=Qipengyuania flava TaxID=192812 RepID=A0A5P6NCU5_9SPHN|nr:hypothetical protein [Qipengyuania flava]QFI63718.1 hypothetical protein D0Y83_10935 [Qipengyuania flava]